MVDASNSFDYREMHQYLNEIETYLAELHYIDQVFTHMASVESTSWEIAAEIASAGFASGSWFTVDFAGTVSFRRTWSVPPPFPPRLIWQDSVEEELRKQMEEYKANASGWALDNMASIRSAIKPMAHPAQSVYLNELIQPVRDALARLEDSVDNDFGDLRHSLGNWSGDAAEEFATNFYNPFEHTLASHHRMLAALVTGLDGAHAIVGLTQQSLMNVLKATRDALLEQLGSRAQQAAAQQQEQGNKHILIISSMLIPMLKEQAIWDKGLDLLSAGTAAAVASSVESMDEHALSGDTAEELLHALTDTIALIERSSSKQYDSLDSEVKAVLARMDLIHDAPDGRDGRLVPPQPRLLDGTDSNDFYLPMAR